MNLVYYRIREVYANTAGVYFLRFGNLCNRFLKALLCICKLNRYRHISVRVGPLIPHKNLKACEFRKSAVILRQPRHEIWRFPESDGMV